MFTVVVHHNEEECLQEVLTLKDETSLISSAFTKPPAVSITQKQWILSLKKLTRNEAPVYVKQCSQV
jgi:hypothetical protein